MKRLAVLLTLILALLIGAMTSAEAHPRFPTPPRHRPTATYTPTPRFVVKECFRYPCPTAWGNSKAK